MFIDKQMPTNDEGVWASRQVSRKMLFSPLLCLVSCYLDSGVLRGLKLWLRNG